MPGALPRRLKLALPLALVLASGCFGTPTATTVRSGNSARTATRSATSPTPQPRLTAANPLKGPSPKPSPSATPTPGPSAPPNWPAVVAQPVALNPVDAIGLSALTSNYLAVSCATDKPSDAMRLSVADAAGTDATATAAPTASNATFHALDAQALDAHVAQRRAEAEWLAAYHPKPSARYALQQAASTGPVSAGALPVGTLTNFYVITDFEAKNYTDSRITARLAVAGSHCYVYIDQEVDRSADATLIQNRAKEIQQVFDQSIYPTDTRLFGNEPNPGVDKDAHIVILLTPAVGNYGKDNTLGYFSQRDEFSPTPDAPAIFQHSNAKEMLYISSRIVASGSAEDYLGTIAHEFQHMINFNQKVLIGKQQQSDDLWIDEGMAMYAIEACGYGLKSGGQVLANHVKRYQDEPESFSLTSWEGNPEGIGYGAVYLFMVYLADRFSESIIHDIVGTKDEGIPNIDAQLRTRGASFNRVFHDWALANLLDGRPQPTDARYRYTSLEMMGANGKTRLAGFRTRALGLPSDQALKLRPYSARYFELPSGESSPRFSWSPADGSGTQPRLVLP